MVKLQENRGRYNVTIPQEIIGHLGWKKGKQLIVQLKGKDNIEIIAVKSNSEVGKKDETENSGKLRESNSASFLHI